MQHALGMLYDSLKDHPVVRSEAIYLLANRFQLELAGNVAARLKRKLIESTEDEAMKKMMEMRIHAMIASGNCDPGQGEAAIRAFCEAYPRGAWAAWSHRYIWLRACAALKAAKAECQRPAAGWQRRAQRLLAEGCPG